MIENRDLNLIRQSFVCIKEIFCCHSNFLSSIELGILKFAVFDLILCDIFIESELNAIILRRGLTQV